MHDARISAIASAHDPLFTSLVSSMDPEATLADYMA